MFIFRIQRTARNYSENRNVHSAQPFIPEKKKRPNKFPDFLYFAAHLLPLLWFETSRLWIRSCICLHAQERHIIAFLCWGCNSRIVLFFVLLWFFFLLQLLHSRCLLSAKRPPLFVYWLWLTFYSPLWLPVFTAAFDSRWSWHFCLYCFMCACVRGQKRKTEWELEKWEGCLKEKM